MDRVFRTRSWQAATLCILIGFALVTSGAAAPDTSAISSQGSSSTSSKKSSTHKKHSKSKKSGKKRGQQAIDSERARQIQEALIREHYMEGSPSGKWDDSTQAALRRFQADQGWQSKTVPDSRALIKLGLGPNQDHLLNPESAMTTVPVPAGTKADPKGPAAGPSASPSQAPTESGTPQR